MLAAIKLSEPCVVPCLEERLPGGGEAADRWEIRVDGREITFDRDEVTRVTPLFEPRLAGRRPAQLPSPPMGSEGRRSASEGPMSAYDDIIVKYATRHGLDWRLVRAVAVQESGLQAGAEGQGGAYGLMQVTPIAAREVGEDPSESPERNISAGVRYLVHLQKMFPNARGRDRLALILAAYNLGPGHVRDAQLLAERFGYDANRWEGALEDILPLLEQPAVSAELPGGFARGNRGVDYVNRVMERYDRYRAVLGNAPRGAGTSRALD